MWSIVSGIWSQKMHLQESYKPWRNLLSAVQHLLCITSQKKKHTLGGAVVFQISDAPSSLEALKNMAP
jgi:hypothetical protein